MTDKITGYVSVAAVGPGGARSVVSAGHNTVLYACADAMARVFAGDSSARPHTVVFVHGAAGLAAAFHFDGTRTAKTQGDIVGTGLSVHEVIIADNPKRSASGDDYTGNTVTFGATSAPDLGATTVYGLLLEAADGTVLAVRKFSEPMVTTGGYALSVSWSLTFS